MNEHPLLDDCDGEQPDYGTQSSALPTTLEALRQPNTSLGDDHQRAFEKMLENGWCIRQVQFLAQVFDTHTFSYLSRLKRSPVRQESHLNCSVDGCIAYNVDMASYTTRHATEDCSCEMIGVPYDSLVDTIRSGEIPLVSVEDCPDSVSGITLKLHKRRYNASYRAVSHVWFDGLGNPKSNTLPACQLRRFDKQVCVTGAEI